MISSIAVINIERGYANKTMQNDMQRIIDIFGRRSNRSSYFFYSSNGKPANSHALGVRLTPACGLKTSISRRLTPAGQFLTPG